MNNMKYFKNNKILGSIVIALALVFVVGLAGAPAAHAQYYSYGNSGYAYQYGGTYAYNNPVYYTAPTYYTYYSPLSVSCYPNTSNANAGSAVTWSARVSGGSGSYSYSWSGTDGLSGYGSSVSMDYYNPGIKTATLFVSSSGVQSQSVSCSGSVNVYANPVTYYNPAPVYNSSPYYPTSSYYNPLQISCSSNTSMASIGSTVIWSASVNGGNGSYTYSWSGSDGIAGYAQSLATVYSTPGQKLASVTVYSNGQTLTESCGSTVNISGGYYGTNYPVTVSPSNNGSLDIGCYADPSTASVNQPITWNVEVTGGLAPYTYSWTGSDGLTGSQSSIIKYYASSGSKSAIVTVTSADGRTGTRACTDTATVGRPASSYTAPAAPAQTTNVVQPASQPVNVLPAAVFSLGTIPWGWVAVLIILILFGVVLYLVFNRSKI